MTAVATPDAARLVFAAVAGLILLLILIIKFKVHAMISILIGAVGIGLMAGMPLSDIIGSVNEGIGNTLKGIALLVGLGSMFGAILEESGGAQTLAVTMVRRFGDEKAAWALGITGLVVAMPVFFDAGLIILIPLAFSLAKRTKRSVLYYVIPLLAGLAVGHAFIPPTPGPVLVASTGQHGRGGDFGTQPRRLDVRDVHLRPYGRRAFWQSRSNGRHSGMLHKRHHRRRGKNPEVARPHRRGGICGRNRRPALRRQSFFQYNIHFA